MKTIAAAVDSNESRVKPGSTSPTQGTGFGQSNRAPRREGGNPEGRNNAKEPRPEGDRPFRDNNRAPRDGNRPPRNFDGPRPEGGRNFRNDRPDRTDRNEGNRGSRDGQRPGGRGRDFDRHSGDVRSGVKATEKRGGQGAHNWGKPTDFDAAPEQELLVVEDLDTTPTEGLYEFQASHNI